TAWIGDEEQDLDLLRRGGGNPDSRGSRLVVCITNCQPETVGLSGRGCKCSYRLGGARNGNRLACFLHPLIGERLAIRIARVRAIECNGTRWHTDLVGAGVGDGC